MPTPDAAPGGDPLADWQGFTRPYYTQTPDEFYDVLLGAGNLSTGELRCLLYIIRHTFGWKKESDAISLSQFTDGIIKSNGERLDWGAGVSRPTAWKALQTLEARNIITVQRSRTAGHGDETNCYSLRVAEPPQVSRITPPGKPLNRGRQDAPAALDKPLTSQETLQETPIQEGAGLVEQSGTNGTPRPLPTGYTSIEAYNTAYRERHK